MNLNVTEVKNLGNILYTKCFGAQRRGLPRIEPNSEKPAFGFAVFCL
jgi:hypothetical protein